MKRLRLLPALVAILAFGAGVLVVGWRAEHQRVECYRQFADEELVADAKCEHPPLW